MLLALTGPPQVGQSFSASQVADTMICMKPRWQFWIDRGETFTDIVARRPDGRLVVHKLLSEHSERSPDAALQGIRELLELSPDSPLPTERIEAIKMGTTLGTNALLERKGECTALLITKGFGDALRIGYQNRPDVFALHIVLSEPLPEVATEVSERMSATGEDLEPVDATATREALEKAFNAGSRALAIVLLHGYRYPGHERQVAQHRVPCQPIVALSTKRGVELRYENRSRGRMREQAVHEWLQYAPYPARNPWQNLADLRALIAANEKGAQGLRRLVVGHYSLATVTAYMRHAQDNAEQAVRSVVTALKDGSLTYALNDGHEIRVSVSVNRVKKQARIDFSGTSPQHTGSFNAPRLACVAAVVTM